MIPNGLITQIGMIIVSLGIIFTYIRPTFTEISSVQDNILQYQEEKDKIARFNSELASVRGQINNISDTNKRRLLTYLPDSVDTIAVPRDLQIYAQEAGLIIRSIQSNERLRGGGLTDASGQSVMNAVPVGFRLTVEGTYSQIKQLVRSFEQNEYPIEIQKMNIQTMEGGFLSADFELQSYEHLFIE